MAVACCSVCCTSRSRGLLAAGQGGQLAAPTSADSSALVCPAQDSSIHGARAVARQRQPGLPRHRRRRVGVRHHAARHAGALLHASSLCVLFALVAAAGCKGWPAADMVRLRKVEVPLLRSRNGLVLRATPLSMRCWTLYGPTPSVSYVRPAPQLGTFPFDNVKNPDADSDEAHRELWQQQIENSWSKVPHIRPIVGQASAAPKHSLTDGALWTWPPIVCLHYHCVYGSEKTPTHAVCVGSFRRSVETCWTAYSSWSMPSASPSTKSGEAVLNMLNCMLGRRNRLAPLYADSLSGQHVFCPCTARSTYRFHLSKGVVF